MIRDGVITLADGTEIDALSGKKIKSNSVTTYAIPTTSEAQQLVTKTRRKLSDLPNLPSNMHLFAAVLTYTLFGLDDSEIALAVDKPLEQITRIKMMPEYDTLYNGVMEQVMQNESANVRDLIRQSSLRAAKTLVGLLDSESESMQLMASKDLLDRDGHRPADVIMEQRNKSESELTIRFVKEDKTAQIPTIDLGRE